MIAPLKLVSAGLWKLRRDRLLLLGRRLGFVLGRVIRLRRAEVIGAISRCLPDLPPEKTAAIADAMYSHLGMNLAESLVMDRIDPDFLERYVAIDNLDAVFEAMRAGKGVILLTAHIGNFDLMCLKSAHVGVPLTIITKAIKPKSLNDYWMAARCRYGMKTVPHHKSALACSRVLRRNEALGFIFDQNMKRHEGVFVDFFGRPACTSPGLAFLSAACRSPVVPVFITRNADGSHTVGVEPPLAPPPDSSEQAILEATARYTAIVENAVRRAPEQWLWLHRRWRTQPAPI